MNDRQIDYFERKLDDKNRLTIPASLQEEFGARVVITRGFGDYLHLYPEKIWNSEMEPALSGNILDERVADLNIRFRSGKVVTALDKKQGRITLESHHLVHAKIDRDVVVVRAGKYWRLMAAAK